MEEYKEIKLIAIDDNKLDKELIKIACGIIGVTVYCTSRVDEFLEKVKEYHGAIIDYTMPTINGVDLYEKIKSKNPELPVMFITNCHPESTPYTQMSKHGVVCSKSLSDSLLETTRIFLNAKVIPYKNK